jgi:hypothetical protein
MHRIIRNQFYRRIPGKEKAKKKRDEENTEEDGWERKRSVLSLHNNCLVSFQNIPVNYV